jgi:hypothetical protein
MIVNHHDNEARALLHARKLERDSEWLRGQIGEATYLRSLLILGYPIDEARMELSMLSRPDRGCA